MAVPLYQNLEAGSSQIRLIMIYSGLAEDPLECSLEINDLKNLPKYTALSCYSGPEADSQQITLNGRLIRIGANLESALRRLRVPQTSLGPRVAGGRLFVDALCINPNDGAERKSQVLMLRDIYEKAAQAFIWLGEETPETRASFNFLENIVSKIEKHNGHVTSRDMSMSDLNDAWRFDNHDGRDESREKSGIELNHSMSLAIDELNKTPELVHYVSVLVMDLLQRPWWSRIWSIQEVLRSTSATVICGSDWMPWVEFAMAISSITSTRCVPDSSYHGFKLRNLHFVDKILKLAGKLQTGTPLALDHLVTMFGACSSTDPKDIVYALRGLSDVARDQLKPDYSPLTTHLDVYMELMEYSLTYQNSLDMILSAAGHSLSELPLPAWLEPDWNFSFENSWPSWLPDWSKKIIPGWHPVETWHRILPESVPYPLNLRHWSEVGIGSKPQWDASGFLIPNAAIDRRDSSLTVRGFYIDYVHLVGEPLNPGIPDRASPDGTLLRHDIKPWGILATSYFGHHLDEATGCTILDVSDRLDVTLTGWPREFFADPIWRTQFTEQNRKIRESGRLFSLGALPGQSGKYITGRESLLTAYVRTLATDRTLRGLPERLTSEDYLRFWLFDPESQKQLSQREIELGKDHAVVHAIMTSICCRSLLLSKQGYMGLGPVGAMEGDLICVLFGCSVPVLLRAERNGYRFIGECYVHGLMDGEALKLAAVSNLETRTFVIR